MVRNAIAPEIKNPREIANIFKVSSEYIASMPIKKTDPRMVGIAKRNANFAAGINFKPMNIPPVIAIPDLDAPGRIANACMLPIIKACQNVNWDKSFDFLPN